MSSSGGSTSRTANPVAEAKLRRQQQRIQMDAAPGASSMSYRTYPRGKDSMVKIPIDWNISEQHDDTLGTTAPPTKVRVNTLYQHRPSKTPSLGTSMSGPLEQPPATAMVRHDSRLEYGFHRQECGGGRHQEAFAPLEGDPEGKQKTVEATFDKREIYEVFATELPNLDFIHANVGMLNGQLQFVQHPNGDVSAHMWSADRLLWDNIGSYSNIRKKIEGQIANDRLKGETAGQALQRHTLAYFRAIAKQKEHMTMGYAFGQAEIQELLPRPQGQTSLDSMTEKKALQATTAITHSQSKGHTEAPAASAASNTSVAGGAHRAEQKDIQSISHQVDHQGVQSRVTRLRHQSQAAHHGFLDVQKLLAVKHEDPFTTPSSALTSSSDLSGSAPVFSSKSVLNSAANDRSSDLPGAPKLGPRSMPFFALSNASCPPAKDHTPRDPIVTPPPVKPGTPLASREAMRDQLFKLGATAKERSLSQANIRTVWYDPLQARSVGLEEPPTSTITHSNSSPSKSDLPVHGAHPDISNTNIDGFHYAGDSPHFRFADCLGTSLRRQCSLGDSVPDTNDSHHARGLHMPVSPAAATSQSSLRPSASSWEQELTEWWWSGNKVLRQAEFYQSIVAPSQNQPLSPHARPDGTTSSPHPRLPGTPGSSAAATPDDPLPFSAPATRILLPIYENLAAYVQGPPDQRRDYWSNWSAPPEYAVDPSPRGNRSFFEDEWGTPPARIGRDPRYARVAPGELRFGGVSPGFGRRASGGAAVGSPPIAAGGAGAGAGAGAKAVMSGGIPGPGARYSFGGRASRGRY